MIPLRQHSFYPIIISKFVFITEDGASNTFQTSHQLIRYEKIISTTLYLQTNIYLFPVHILPVHRIIRQYQHSRRRRS